MAWLIGGRIGRTGRLLLLALVVGLGGLGAEAFWFGPRDLVVTRLSAAVLPPGSAAITAVVIADTQPAGPHDGLPRLRRVFELANAQGGDVVLLLGDYVDDRTLRTSFVDPEEAIPLFGSLTAPMGVFAVLGNHDWAWDGVRMAALLRAQGIVILENEAVLATAGGQRLWIAGLADRNTRGADIARALADTDETAPVVLLTHNPDVFPEVPAGVAMTFAGHTHGGQVDLPLLGRLVVPSIYGQRFAYGHIVEDERHLYVSSGVGTAIIPVRFRVPPEIVVITLTAAQ